MDYLDLDCLKSINISFPALEWYRIYTSIIYVISHFHDSGPHRSHIVSFLLALEDELLKYSFLTHDSISSNHDLYFYSD